ncbi:uncharacterized protein RAG0_11033 [Rhynchosporium agropyri]|uniref:BHLH domain-containing protein n=1 Tax=Rhynchosporium agropyri TaxID=914238 RepID=A0A1E1L299_9HELO|nr:uncharacterized protein RAG0_11033 [Rhynchosporium agropyri]
MPQIQDHSSQKMQQNTVPDHENWSNEWPRPMWHWETTATTPTEMPLWQYTAAALNSGEFSSSYFPIESQTVAHSIFHSSLSSTNNSPRGVQCSNDGRFPSLVSNDERRIRQSDRSIPLSLQLNDDDEMEEDSDEVSWEPRTPSGVGYSTVSPSRSQMHRRVKSSTETLTRDARRAHTVVERNYRERLNDKIAELGLYLFETSSDSRTKPSKSLVMTRAKERLEQLEAQNKALEAEVTKLKQHIAILDHVSARGEQGLPSPE